MSKKKRTNVVYSTNPDFEYEYENNFIIPDTLSSEKQKLRVVLDSKKRRGKIVTLVTGFIGTEEDLKDLGKKIKTKCGVGGSAKDNEIIIQGELKDKVIEILKGLNYNVK